MLGGSLEWHRQPPLYFFALKFWIDLFGDFETAIRTLSAILGVASIPLVFFIGRILFNSRVGLIAVFLSAISYFQIRFSQEGRDYAMLVFFTLLSFFLFIRLIKLNRSGKWDFIFYCIANILLIYTHYFGLFVVAAQIFYFVLIRRQVNINGSYFWRAQLATGIVFLPWAIGLVLFSIPNSFSMGQPGLEALISTLRNYSGYISTSIWLLLIMGCLCLTGLVYRRSIYHQGRIDDNIIEINSLNRTIFLEWDVLLLLVWLVFPVVIPFLVSQIPLEMTGIYLSKYTISALPAFILLASKGLDVFLTKKYLHPVFISIILAITILSGIGLQDYYTTIKKEQWREAINQMEPLIQDNDVIILNQNYFSMAFDYYAKGRINTQAIPDGEETQIINLFKTEGKQRIWLVQGPWGSITTKEYMEKAFDERSLLLKEIYVGLEVYLFDLTSEDLKK